MEETSQEMRSQFLGRCRIHHLGFLALGNFKGEQDGDGLARANTHLDEQHSGPFSLQYRRTSAVWYEELSCGLSILPVSYVENNYPVYIVPSKISTTYEHAQSCTPTLCKDYWMLNVYVTSRTAILVCHQGDGR